MIGRPSMGAWLDTRDATDEICRRLRSRMAMAKDTLIEPAFNS